MLGSSNKKLAKQILGTGGLGALGQLASFLGVIAYTRLTPQEVLGSYFLLVAILRITSFIGGVGVSSDITRRINQSEKPSNELSIAATFILLVVVLITVCAFMGRPIVNTYVGNGFGIFLVLLLPVSIFALLTDAVLEGEKKNTRAMALITAQKVSTYSIGSIAIISGLEPGIALAGGLFCGKLVELGGGILLMDVYPTGIPRLGEVRKLACRVRNLTAAGLGNLGQQWIDTLLIGVLLTPTAVAVYEVAWRLSAVGLIVTNAVVSVLYPRFAEAANNKNYRKIKNYTNKAFVYVSAPMIALIAGALALGTGLITVLYGESYSAAYIPLLILLVGRLPYSLSRITTVLCYSFNRDEGVTRASVLAALLNAGVNVLLIPLIGLAGAAISSFLSYTIMMVLLLRLLSDQISNPQITQFLPSVVSAGIMLIYVRILSKNLSSNLLTLILLVVTGAALFFIVLIIASPDVKSDIRNILGESG